MGDNKFHVEKNIKDLEYSNVLTTLNASVVIAATLIITIVFAESVPFFAKTFSIALVIAALFYQTTKLNRRLDEKIQEIKELQ